MPVLSGSQQFRLNITADNAAFGGDDPMNDNGEDEAATRAELARILRVIADQLESARDVSMFQTIFDANGNDVGRYALKDAAYFEA